MESIVDESFHSNKVQAVVMEAEFPTKPLEPSDFCLALDHLNFFEDENYCSLLSRLSQKHDCTITLKDGLSGGVVWW